MKKSKNSNDAVALALAGGGFLAHSDLERNGLAWLFNLIFYLICQQVRFLFHGERKKVIFLSFTAANWVVDGGCISIQRRYPIWHFCWSGHFDRFAGLDA